LHYTYRAGRGRRGLHGSMLLFRDREPYWPEFQVYPRSLLPGAGSQGEITFEDVPEFSKCYLLQSEDKARVRELFNGEVRNFFARHEGIAAGAAGRALVYFTGELVTPERVRPFMEEGFRVMNVLQTGRQPS